MYNIIILFLFFTVSIYSQSWFTNEQAGDLMVSGRGFNQTGGVLMFNHPTGLATNGTNLILCDRFNNRVLIWNTAPLVWNDEPDLVLGQTDFNSNNPGPAKNNFNWPGNASIGANGKLAIVDTYNHRVLLWNSMPTANGQPADISLHLPTIWGNMGAPGNRWEWPWGVWTDGTRLAVTATQGSRILFWNTFPVSDNQNPDYTISHSHFGTPRSISSDGSTYFMVGDHNAKVNGDQAGTFFWNSYPTTQNQVYDFYRQEWIKGAKLPDGKFVAGGQMNIYTWYAVPTASNHHPAFVATPPHYNNGDGPDVVYAGGKIYVNNYNGNNIYVYSNYPTSSSPNPDLALSVSSYTYNSLDSIGYIQNPAFATDGRKLIVASDFDRKFYVYNTFPTASGRIYDQSISTFSYDLAPWDITVHNDRFIAVGKKKVCIWNNVNSINTAPSTIYNNGIGTAAFNDLRGIAINDNLFCIGDYEGKVYIWYGYPSGNMDNPDLILNFGMTKLGRLSCDQTYLTVVKQEPAGICIYRVSDLLAGNTTPFKEFNGGVPAINLPNEAITFNGSVALANTNYSTVLLWRDINTFPDTAGMIVIGQPSNNSSNVPQIGQNRLFLPATLLFHNNTLWVGEVKFSSRIIRFSFPSQSSTQIIPAGSTTPVTFGATGISVQFTSPNSQPLQLNVSKYPFTPGGVLPQGIVNISPEYWKFNIISGSVTSPFSLIIDVSSICGINNKNTLRLLRRPGIGGEWVNLGTPSSVNGNNVVWSNLTDFSEFALGSDDSNPLPVELTSFSAEIFDGKVMLKWATASEKNNFGYEIERKADNGATGDTVWKKIGFINGAGNSEIPLTYTFTDQNPVEGIAGYRLKQIDYSGKFTYSNEIKAEVRLPIVFALYQNYPNPFNSATSLKFTLKEDGLATLKVFDMLGSEIATLFNDKGVAGKIYQIDFDASNLPSGTYYFKLESGSYRTIKKSILVK